MSLCVGCIPQGLMCLVSSVGRVRFRVSSGRVDLVGREMWGVYSYLVSSSTGSIHTGEGDPVRLRVGKRGGGSNSE